MVLLLVANLDEAMMTLQAQCRGRYSIPLSTMPPFPLYTNDAHLVILSAREPYLLNRFRPLHGRFPWSAARKTIEPLPTCAEQQAVLREQLYPIVRYDRRCPPLYLAC